METKIKKWGNSLALRLPKSIVESLRLIEGSEVGVFSDEGKITITPRQKDTPTLKELVDQITPETLHTEFSWDESVGKEVW